VFNFIHKKLQNKNSLFHFLTSNLQEMEPSVVRGTGLLSTSTSVLYPQHSNNNPQLPISRVDLLKLPTTTSNLDTHQQHSLEPHSQLVHAIHLAHEGDFASNVMQGLSKINVDAIMYNLSRSFDPNVPNSFAWNINREFSASVPRTFAWNVVQAFSLSTLFPSNVTSGIKDTIAGPLVKNLNMDSLPKPDLSVLVNALTVSPPHL
jgi:hypothetical protein